MTLPKSYNGKSLVHAWTYCAKDGAPFGVVARYQSDDGKKEIVPFFKRNGTGWTIGAPPEPRPLFGLERLAKHLKDHAVFIVEGEKAAAALHGLNVCAVTSLGGAQAASKSDWTALNGFKIVYILPDNDEPGEHYAQSVYAALQALESPPVVKVLRLSQLPEGGDIVDWVQSFISWNGYDTIPDNLSEATREQLQEELKNAEPVPESWNRTTSTTVVDWSEPYPINTTLKPVPPFDLKLLPKAFNPWVTDIAERMQCPVDYPAIGVMVALSAVVGRKGLVFPKRLDDWHVCPNLWGLGIGRPSAMKTPSANEILKPLQQLEIKAKQDFERDETEHLVETEILEIGRKVAQEAAKKLVKDGKHEEAKQLLMENNHKEPPPVRRRYILNDTTIEKLGEILNENPNGVLLFRDEISGFLKTMDREDRANDRAFYLEAFDGKGRYTFDRIGRGTVDIESTCVAMLGNIQPGVLRPYLSRAASGGAGNDGMIQRFQLMVWPDLPKWEHIDRWANKAAKEAAFLVFERLAQWAGYTEPARFSEEAQAVFDNWFCHLNQRLRGEDMHPMLEEHLGKYKSLVPSLAVLLHLADDCQHTQIISVNAASKAIAWAEYLEQHAHRVFGSAVDSADINAESILCKIKDKKIADGFTYGDIRRGNWTGLTESEVIKAAIERLAEYGYIKQQTIPSGSLGGRPSIRYLIHPEFLPKAPG